MDGRRGLSRFWAEVKRRKVHRVALGYAIVAFAALELVDVVVPMTRLPDWTDELLLSLVILGIPIAVYLSWVFDITPTGAVEDDGGEEPVGGTDAREAMESSGAEAERVVLPEAGVAPVGGVAARRADGRTDLAQAAVAHAPFAPDETSVAVLPSRGLAEGDHAAPFITGLHDDLLTELSRIPSLTVIARSSVDTYAEGDRGLAEIARALGVGTVVEGTVRQAGNRVRLNVKLVDARTMTHRWAERYDRELTADDLFDLQAELSRKIADTLRSHLEPATLLAQARTNPTADAEAYRLHARGRTLLAQRTAEGLQGAADAFEAATKRDDGYAEAWAGLAHARILMADYGHATPETMLERGYAAARRALELDPDLAAAHSALGNHASASRDCPTALTHHERAASLQPGYAQAHQWICWVRLLLGEPGPAVDAGRRGTRLDPLDPEARANLAIALVGTGAAEEALIEARRSSEDQPDFEYGRWAEAMALQHLGRGDEAAAILAELTDAWAAGWARTAADARVGRPVVGDDASADLAVDGAFGDGPGGDGPGGDDDAADLHRRRLRFQTAMRLANDGEVDAALGSLSAALPMDWPETLYFRYAPPGTFDTLNDDPRYEEIRAKLDRSWGRER